MRLSTGLVTTSLEWIHAFDSLGRREYCTCSQPSGPWSSTMNARFTCSGVGFDIVSNALVAPGLSYSATVGTVALAASKPCGGSEVGVHGTPGGGVGSGGA